jgi:uncharacterized damage-inducible protein DinB
VDAGTPTAAALAKLLRRTAAALIDGVRGIDPDRWSHVPAPGVWSVGEEAEHVVEGVAYHTWIVRMTIGEKVASRRPPLERRELTTRLSPDEMAHLLRERTDESARLIESLTAEQLSLPPRPPRARLESLAVTIERMLIGHIRSHHREIESKLDRHEAVTDRR